MIKKEFPKILFPCWIDARLPISAIEQTVEEGVRSTREELGRAVYELIRVLRAKAEEFKRQRKYKLANKYSKLAAILGDASRPIEWAKPGEDPRRLLRDLGFLFFVTTDIFWGAEEIPIEVRQELKDRIEDLAIEIVLELLGLKKE